MSADDKTPRLPKALLENNSNSAKIRFPSFSQDRPGLWLAHLQSQFRN